MRKVLVVFAILVSGLTTARANTVDMNIQEFTYYDYSYSFYSEGFSYSSIGYPDYGVYPYGSPGYWEPSIFLGFFLDGIVDRPLRGKTLNIFANRVFFDSPYSEGNYVFGDGLDRVVGTITFDNNQDVSAWNLFLSSPEPFNDSYHNIISSLPSQTLGRNYYDSLGDELGSSYSLRPGKWTQTVSYVCLDDDYWTVECRSPTPPAPVPLPASVLLLGGAMGLLVVLQGRRRLR